MTSQVRSVCQRGLNLLLALLLLLPANAVTLFVRPPVAEAAPVASPRAVPPVFAAPAVGDPSGASKVSLPVEGASQREIPEARTLHSSAYELGDGRIAVVQDPRPLNYQDDAGRWQPVDPTFDAVDGGWINTRNTLKTSVAQTGSQAKISLESVGVGWEPQALQLVDKDGEPLRTIAAPLPTGAALAGIRSQDSRAIRYPKSWDAPGLEDNWQLAAGSAAYSLRLAERPTLEPWLAWSPWHNPHWLELRVTLHLKPGTTIEIGGAPVALPQETAEIVTFVDAGGETLLLQPPAAFEEADPAQRQPGRYLLRRGSAPDTVDLRVRFDWNWLAATERAYPVVLDPVFQTTSPFAAKIAKYSHAGAFLENYTPSTLAVGMFSDAIARSLVRFEMPTMPPGTTIDQAYLASIPSEATWLDSAGNFRDRVQAFALADSNWVTANNAPPATAALLAPYVSNNYVHDIMSYGRGRKVQAGAVWEITNLARTWAANPAANHGVLLRMARECLGTGCSAFYMDYPSTFTDHDLTGKDYYLYDADGGGVKMIVVYQGPQLAEGQRRSSAPPSTDNRYYFADHVYHTPPAPARWQAVVVRGIRTDEGTYIGSTPPLEVLPAGSVPRVQAAAADESQAPAIAGANLLPAINDRVSTAMFVEPNEANYAVINGRQAAGARYDARIRQIRKGNIGSVPSEYEIELVSERSEQIIAQLDGATELVTTFANGAAAGIWNINLPASANNRIDVLFNGTSIGEQNHYYGAGNFAGRVFLGNSGALIRSDNQQASFALTDNREYDYGKFRLESETFPRKRGPSATNVALVLTNNAYVGEGDPVFDYNITVRVTSCRQGSFPTSDGGCQEVQCPIVNVNFTAEGFRRQGELGLWSFAPWTELGPNSASTFFPATAPLIGGGNINRLPTVAVVDGIVRYTAGDVRIERAGSSDPTILLIECQPGSTEFSDWFEVVKGRMQNKINGPEEAWLQSVAPFRDFYVDPWLNDDGPILATIFVDPSAGRVGQTGNFYRYLGTTQASRHRFTVQWSISARGWEDLESSAVRTEVGSTPGVASLTLELGNSFALDFDPVRAKFVALRAKAARITQSAQLGGASKPLQVLIFPSEQPIPSQPPQACDYYNCIDLRGVNDTPANPNRSWQMPDVHVSGQAGMVAVSSAGVLQVYSKDFPDELRTPPSAGGAALASMVNAPAAANDFNANFSYDTFGAKVVVKRGKCVEEDPTEVDIIEGATYISLPSIGSSGGTDARIGSSFRLCQSTLRQVRMEFKTPVGVPLGNSGLFLTGLEGTVDIYPGHTTITFGLDIQAAPGGDGGILKMHGRVTIDTRGLFAFQGQGSVLKGIVGIDGALWVAWNPLDIGFRVSMGYPLKNPWISGMLRAHMWKGQGFANRYTWLPDNDETHIAAQASVTILIKKGAVFSWWFIDIPPSDIHFGIEIAFGQFCSNGPCTQYEWGIKGKFTVVGYDVGLYYTFGRDLSRPEVNPANLSFILGNDSHVLIDQYNGATDVPVMAAQLYSPDALDEVVSVYRSPNAIDAEDDFIPFTVSANAKQLLFGLGWQAGAPQLTLLPPGGGEITPQNAAANGAQFQTSLQSTLVSVQNPAAGAWQARISNLSDDGIEHYQFTYFASKGAPLVEGENIFLTPATPGEAGTDQYRITWRVPAGATDEATISLYATRLGEDQLGNTEQAVPIVQNLPLKQGFFDWNLTSFPFGDYAISGQVDDGINAAPPAASEDLCDVNFNPLPTLRAFDSRRFAITHVFTATGTIQPNDPGFPDAPSNLVLTPQDGAFLARWTPATDPTVTAYQVNVQWSPTEWRDYTVLAGPTPSLRVGALQNDIEYNVTVYAQDVEGKTSDPIFGIIMPQLGWEEAPEPPTDLSVGSAGSGSATLNWQPAVDSTPAGYRVHYVRVGRAVESGQMETTTPSATLTGLQPGATYDVQVSAIHSEGWESDRSAAVRVVATSGVDADGDGLPDDWAAYYGVSGGGNDPDGDGLTNRQEFELGTDPTRQDSDGDGFSDGEEVAAGTDPLDAMSYGDVYSQPRLTLGRDRLVFYTKLQTAGEVAPSATISWTNTGGGNLALAATSSAGWLNAQVMGNEVRVTTAPQGLAPGQYTGVVRLAPAAGSDPLIGPAACIRVQLWASPPDVGGNGLPFRINLPLVSK
jgi:hypothetical protein